MGFCCIAIDPHIVLGEEYDEVIKNYVAELRNSARSGEAPIVLPGDDRIAYLHKEE